MILFFTALLSYANAQSGQRGRRSEPPSITERLERAQKDLSLSDDQLAQWKSIFEKYDGQIQAAREDRDREKGRELMGQMEAELKATLNSDQAEKFTAMQEERKKRGGPGGKRPQRN